MALVTCPECGQRVSDLAACCPHCGCPAAEIRRGGPVETACAEGGSDDAGAGSLAGPAPGPAPTPATGPGGPCPREHRLLKVAMMLHGLCLPLLGGSLAFLLLSMPRMAQRLADRLVFALGSAGVLLLVLLALLAAWAARAGKGWAGPLVAVRAVFALLLTGVLLLSLPLMAIVPALGAVLALPFLLALTAEGVFLVGAVAFWRARR